MAEDRVARVDAFAVDQNQRIAAVEAANADALAVIAFVGELHARHVAQDIFQVLNRAALQILLSNHADTGRSVFYALFSRRGGDNQRFFIHFGYGRKRQRYDGCAQSRPDKRV